MTPSLRKKLARLVTLSEEMDQGGVQYGEKLVDVWPQIHELLRDMEILSWIDSERAKDPDLLRRL